jgi:hypothetical protein
VLVYTVAKANWHVSTPWRMQVSRRSFVNGEQQIYVEHQSATGNVVSSASQKLYIVERKPVFATPRSIQCLKSTCIATQPSCALLLRSSRDLVLACADWTLKVVRWIVDRAARMFAAFANIPYHDRHKQKELEQLISAMQV